MKFNALPRSGLILLMLAVCWFFYQKSRVGLQSSSVVNQPAPVSEEATNQTESTDPKSTDPKSVEAKDSNASATSNGSETTGAADEQENTAASDQPATASQSETAAEVSGNESPPSQDERLAEWLTLIQDNTLEMHRREMPAYWRFLSMSKGESFGELNERARKDFVFNDFYRHAKDHRGSLASLELNVRRVTKYPAPPGNSANVNELYEVWGWTNQSQAWVYVVVTPELPSGIRVGDTVQYKAKFAGYFFKLQAYQSALSKPGDRPLVAPLFIGRFETIESKKVEKPPTDMIQTILLFAVGSSIVVGLFVYFNKSNSRKHRNTNRDTKAKSTDDDLEWLAQSLDKEKQPDPLTNSTDQKSV